MTETLTVERSEIASLRDSTLSLMPEGLLEALPPEQARDLIAYLMHKTQMPLPSERTLNARLIADTGAAFVLKLHPPQEAPDVDLEVAALDALRGSDVAHLVFR